MQHVFGHHRLRTIHPYIFQMAKASCNYIHPDQTLRSLAICPFVNIMKRGADMKRKKMIADALGHIQGTGSTYAPRDTDVSHQCSELQNEIQKVAGLHSEVPGTEFVYYNEMAMLATKYGEHIIAELMHMSAKSVEHVDSTVLDNLHMLYTEAYVKLRQLEKLDNNIHGVKDEILMWGHIGLELVEREIIDQNAVNTVWKNLFLLLFVPCLLGIGINGSVNASYENEESANKAKFLLSQLDQGFQE